DGGEGLTHQFLVRERAVDLGGVEEGDPEIDGRPDDLDPLLRLEGRAVARTEPHAAKAQGRHLKVALPEFALLHGALLWGCARRQVEQQPRAGGAGQPRVRAGAAAARFWKMAKPSPPTLGARGHVPIYRPPSAIAIPLPTRCPVAWRMKHFGTG